MQMGEDVCGFARTVMYPTFNILNGVLNLSESAIACHQGLNEIVQMHIYILYSQS